MSFENLLADWKHAAPADAAAVRELDYAVVGFSASMEAEEKVLKAFLFQHMYRHKNVMRPVEAAQQILGDLYDAFWSGASVLMPETPEWSLAGP